VSKKNECQALYIGICKYNVNLEVGDGRHIYGFELPGLLLVFSQVRFATYQDNGDIMAEMMDLWVPL